MISGSYIKSKFAFGLFVCSLTCAVTAEARPPDQPNEELKQLEGVGVTEKLGAQIPDLTFTNSDGKPIKLRSLFDGERPVLLTMNYSDCPMLCSLQLKWTIGTEYRLVTVSLDPTEKVERSASTKERYLNQLTRSSPEGWHFLTGDEASVKALAEAVGFGYRYSEERQEYLHAAAIMVMSPKGKVSRYLHGLGYSPQTLRLSMVEASQGKQVSTLDAVVLYCFYYDSEAGNYTPVVRNLLKIAAAGTVVVLAIFVIGGWRRKKRRKGAKEKEVEAHVAHV